MVKIIMSETIIKFLIAIILSIFPLWLWVVFQKPKAKVEFVNKKIFIGNVIKTQVALEDTNSVMLRLTAHPIFRNKGNEDTKLEYIEIYCNGVKICKKGSSFENKL